MKKENKILALLSFIFLAAALSFDVNYFDYALPIEHSRYGEISLKDFKGFKRINENLYGNNGFAFISSEISIFKNDNTIDVEALFHPSRSYVFNDNMIGDKNLLSHELYHFHITEYIARKIRKEIHESPDTDIGHLGKKYNLEERKLQREYDEETSHSYYMGKQLKWEHRIDSLLNTLKAYKQNSTK